MVDHLVGSDANLKRIQRIESAFGTSGIALVRKDRVLLGEGILTKICKKKPKARQFFLFSDILVYGNIVINNKKFNQQRIIPLEEIKLREIDDEGDIRNGWFICSQRKSFAVFASTPIEKQQWMDHINRAVTDHIREANVRVSATFAATMVPDSEAKLCMHCQKTQFTFVNRRHHCRKCGMVVCGNCSSQKAIIADQSDKPQRVCSSCAVTLKREGGGGLPREISANGSTANTPDSPVEEDSDDDTGYTGSGTARELDEKASFYERVPAAKRNSSEDEGQMI
ncbi:Pleckstrin-like proteiny domain-containing family F member 2 [Hypsibius exemplaris]|uniref:Pleckstrin-like proteiny domain-containing family F member 2 n=1 Tax=Hypsibius exemplaris TaxID=2072580 RepID=A0A1W0W8C7_HYPEX|nr:Pleckstrin-like proteiny domain-containing family F member 2 [Hypsibius exemplaris]